MFLVLTEEEQEEYSSLLHTWTVHGEEEQLALPV